MDHRIHTLRYAVYCKEKAFLDAARYPDGKEYDEFDEYSVHFAAYDRNNEIAGSVRLVIPNENQPFPFESYCQPFPDHVPPPKGKVAEISRLIIAQDFRVKDDKREFGFSAALSQIAGRWRKQPLPEFTIVAPAFDQSSSPRILLGMFRTIYRYSQQNGITHLYAAMEVPLLRLLSRYHVVFHKVSPRVDYYGPVCLYMANLQELEERLERKNPEMLRWMRKTRRVAPNDAGHCRTFAGRWAFPASTCWG